MTRFKELARIEAAIARRDEAELRWAEGYCRMRQQIAVLKDHLRYWRDMGQRVAKALEHNTE